MTLGTDYGGEIDWLFQLLLLTSPAPSKEHRSDGNVMDAYRRVIGILDADSEVGDQHFELRLRLALHLAPVEAIGFEPSSPQSRNRLIREFLKTTFRVSRQLDELSRAVAGVLNSWDEERGSGRGFFESLLRSQGGRCAHCHVSVVSEPGELPCPLPVTYQRQDAYKPLFESPDLLLAEVDHIEPVSKLGGNELKNLQVLCRYCNRGKGDRLGLDTRSEARWAGVPIEDIPRAHKANLLYYVLDRQERTCFSCCLDTHELTMRKVNARGGVIRSNLYGGCVSCQYS